MRSKLAMQRASRLSSSKLAAGREVPVEDNSTALYDAQLPFGELLFGLNLSITEPKITSFFVTAQYISDNVWIACLRRNLRRVITGKLEKQACAHSDRCSPSSL